MKTITIYKIILVVHIVFEDRSVISKQFKKWIAQNILKLLYKKQYTTATDLNPNKDCYKYDRYAQFNQNGDFIRISPM